MATGRASLSTQLRDILSLWRLDVEDIDASLLPYSQPRKSRPHRETRRCRRSYVVGMLKRAVFTLPIVVLSTFGFLHILQVLIGRSHLFWDSDRVEFKFLPDLDRMHRFDNGLFQSTTEPSQDVLPIPCHSHNDYWRREPLFDAVSWGCTGVEADVWLFDEELYLYVDKLVGLLDGMNGANDVGGGTGDLNGVFHRKPDETLTLLVDLKNSGRHAFEVLQYQLSPLREKGYLTYWNGQEVVPRSVTVDAIHELDTAMDYGSAMSIPDDGRLLNPQDVDQYNISTSYYASTSFKKTVGFVWRGHLSPRQMEIIRGQIRGAKRRGLKARYWNTPSWPIALRNHVWHVLVKEGADVLNVDDLAAAARHTWNVRTHQLW
ncbi:hypothetical protein PRZ48_002553 [Zasmidium cellare]|uniref:Altered inheritance of mitochondria protein 6 n=1 Tax=Zasmidium cellare TaxID=395010 RepID=A0ABR0F5V5_ZASCE|nr:hypothetical protein PRZ48_002553 [Zasmidium cellare]